MHVPTQFRELDKSWLADLIRDHPLAQLISNGAGADAPRVTHVPVILDPNLIEPRADLVGATLWGHMSRLNPHWAALGTPTEVVVAFTGPHTYVSPTVYETTPAAPTWDFTAVHVRGLLREVESAKSAEETLESVLATARAIESRFGTGWDMTDSMGYLRQLLPGVGAFRIAVSRVDGMFKLSQEQAPEIRQRVQRSFAQRESTNPRQIAVWMNRVASTGCSPEPAAKIGANPPVSGDQVPLCPGSHRPA
jgi:transcriptional regulator